MTMLFQCQIDAIVKQLCDAHEQTYPG